MNSSDGIPIWQVDAFADRPFTGNPAAVCILERYPSDEWMQNVAMEMNLSETAFVVPTDDAGSFHLRWFTPATEVDLCGHATLAAAHTLIEQACVEAGQPIRFQTRSGELVCTPSDSRITLNFPATPPSDDVDPTVAEQTRGALGIREATVLRSKYDLLVIVEDASIVESLRPNFNTIADIDTRGVMVSAPADRTAPTLFPVSSHLNAGSMKTPSPVRPTAAWHRTGRLDLGRRRWLATKPHLAAAR